MLNKLKIFTLLSLFPLILSAQIKAYPIDTWHSNISFSVKFGGLLPVKGQFENFKGSLLIDENDLTKTSATIFIKTKSINTGVNFRDEHLRKEDFFAAEKHPAISFSSTRVLTSGKQHLLLGNLSMHGVTKEIQIPFELLHEEKLDSWKNWRITLAGAFEINRLDFGIGEGELTIGETVTIELIISGRIFNTETINLFDRPFGQQMIAARESEGKDAARVVYKELKEAGDKDVSNLSHFYFLYLKLKQKENLVASLELTELCAELFPKKSLAFSTLGYAYFENNQTSKAITNFKKALELDENNSLALEMLKVLE